MKKNYLIKKPKNKKFSKKSNNFKRNNKRFLQKGREYNIIHKNRIFILIILLFFIFILEKYKNYIQFIFVNITKRIIDTKYYESFENIKSRYINNTLFKPYLETINIISHTYNQNYKTLKKYKNNINICVSLNNIYVYPQLVSIESVLINCNKYKTYLTYHILCAPDLTESSLSILKSLVYKYPLNIEIIFYNMTNNFKQLYNFRISQAAAYRLASPIIIDEDRIIHLDGDTLTFKDLTKMYKLDFNTNYMIGFLDLLSEGVDYLGINSKTYINSGVILLNLEKIRNDNKTIDLFNFLNSGKKFTHQDQTIINYIFYPKIGILPSEYVIWNFYDESDIKKYLSYLRTELNITELAESLKNPTIIHLVLCTPKIWENKSIYNNLYTTCGQRGNCSCEKYINLWHFYANKTDYYEEIKNFIEKKNKN